MSHHVECHLREVVILALNHTLEARDGVLDVHVLSGRASENLSHLSSIDRCIRCCRAQAMCCYSMQRSTSRHAWPRVERCNEHSNWIGSCMIILEHLDSIHSNTHLPQPDNYMSGAPEDEGCRQHNKR